MNVGNVKGMAASPSVRANARNNRCQLNRNNASPNLVNQIKNGTQQVKEMAIGELCNLVCNNPANQNKMVNADVLPHLIALLRNGTPGAKVSTAKVLSHLSMNIINQRMIVDAGAVPCLISLIENGTQQCKEVASDALYGLLSIIPVKEQKEVLETLVDFPYARERFESLGWLLQIHCALSY